MEQDQDKQVEKKPTHYRRVRYVGTHPVRFAEKYKELNPEEYPEEVAHVIGRGRTPAGMHLPICVQEILDILRVQPGQRGLDATLGWGGHARELLARIQPGGCLYATDVDAIQLPRTRDRLERLGYGPEVLQTRLITFRASTGSPRKPGRSILFWRIWAYHPCRSITPSGVSPSSRTGPWTCA